MKLNLTYFASELNATKVKDAHSTSMFTNHMSCKLYNQKNQQVGSLITRNHYTKINGTHFVTATSTVRLFGRGKFVYHLAYESNNELLKSAVRTVPHFKTDKLENTNMVVVVGPRTSTEDQPNKRVLTVIIRKRPPRPTVQLGDIADFDGEKHVLRANTVIPQGHTLTHAKLHVPHGKTFVNHGRVISTDLFSVEGTAHNFGSHTVQKGVHVLPTGHYHVYQHLELRPSATPTYAKNISLTFSSDLLGTNGTATKFLVGLTVKSILGSTMNGSII